MTIPLIQTERLLLRPFRATDLDAYAAMYADPAFAQFLGGKTLTRDQVWENMAIILGHWPLRGYGLWALEHRETGELLGRAGFLHFPAWPDVEVCWALGPQFHGYGYATEAGKAAIDWAFNERDLPRLISLIHPDHIASEAVARRLGQELCEQITFEGKPTNIFEIHNPSAASPSQAPTGK